MPIYEYKCKACGQSFEKLSSIAEKDSGKVCPFCGKRASEKLISSFMAKGSKPSGASSGGSCGTT